MRISPRILRIAPLAVLILLAASASLSAQALPQAATPESVGLSSARVARLGAVMKEYADKGRVPGLVTLVLRRGRVAHFEAHGRQDLEKNVAMQKDTIFRIASQSKAVTSVAALMLMEEGRLLLNDPVSRFIPGFKKTTVAVAPPVGAAPNSPVAIVASKREITIRDLLTHTAGLSYGGGPAAAQWKAAGLDTFYFADKDETIGSAIDRLATLPMDAQPGEKYIYGYNTDILGSVVERASGVPLDEFFRTRIFEPLKMKDTSFFLPKDQRARLATVYSTKDGGLVRAGEPMLGQGDYVDGPRKCFSGGAGLLSTATDYARFLQMLLNGGELDGVRLLSPTTVKLATVNHVGSLFRETSGFGLGFEVIEDLGKWGRPGSVGGYGWGGAYHTVYWVDPKEELVAVLMTQLLPADQSTLHETFRALVYASIVGSPTGVPAPSPAAKKAVTN
jgi:CubicO group peptidase (beta-lactamase class C family)